MTGKNLKVWSIATMVFVLSLLVILIPNTDLAEGANNKQQNFNMSLVISNTGPSISGVASASGNPSEGTTSVTHIYFNVTDVNGYTDVDPTQSYANVTKGSITRESSECVDYPAWTGGNIRGVDCSITMEYNDEPGDWSISVQAQDSSPTVASSDDAAIMTYGTLYAFGLTKDSVTFTSAEPGANNVNASNDPQILNNTGNGDFAYVNVTGYELTNGEDTIGAGNFTVNATSDAKGITVGSNTLIPGANLNRNTTQDLYIWVDIPSGISDGTYTTNTTTQWLVEAYN